MRMTQQECFQLPDFTLHATLSNTGEDNEGGAGGGLCLKTPSTTPPGKSALYAFCWHEDRKPCNLKEKKNLHS